MLLTRPLHSPEFLSKYNLGVEAHIGRYDLLPNWAQYIPFVHGVHLPYAGCNLAALDEELRQTSLAKLKEALDEGCKYPVDRMVMHSVGVAVFEGEKVGEYDKLIEGLRELAAYAAERNIILCIENQLVGPPVTARFGESCSEWLQLQQDVDRPNVLLTLDTSHAASSIGGLGSDTARIDGMYAFLAHPERIGRIHWSDAIISGGQSLYKDWHLVPGKGDLPLDFHRRINALPVVKLLEQKCTEAEVLEGLEFIKTL